MFSLPQDPPDVLVKLLQFGPLVAVSAIDTTEDWLLGLRLGLPVNGIGVGPIRVLTAVWNDKKVSVPECLAVGLMWSHLCKIRIPMVANWINDRVNEGVREIFQSKTRETLILWYEITSVPGIHKDCKITKKAIVQLLWVFLVVVTSILLQAYGAIALSLLLVIQMLAVMNGMAGTSEVPYLKNRKKQDKRFFIAAPHFSSDSLVLFQGNNGILESTLNGAIQYKSSSLTGKSIACILVAAQAIAVLYATGESGWDAVLTTCLLFGLWLLSQWGKNSSELWRDENWRQRLIRKVKFPTRKSAWFFCALQTENFSEEKWFRHVLPLSSNICLLLKLFTAVRKYKPKTMAEFKEIYLKEGIDRKTLVDLEEDILAAYQIHIDLANSEKGNDKAHVTITMS
ncbi:hypothetical protein K450DRAFT_274368 [Umbelopsis ramanniana AG]|uniref:Uncharacterized protein n=1 Tax=Umbelopsis ramanniana AG TaxID=1314678 RepID=A0AAD5E432_UMBRA|nr:uncharacterized protein K450DRAFT_274368 [Umbelopsis ramanniana AG]KAI8576788.1 hypothetical protein K450DRAFT_274368 [Umbelopsis ramanniana AG]